MLSSDQNIDNYSPDNISDYLVLNAELFPDKPAILHPVRITYKELQAEVDRYSFGLESSGIISGTRTILMIPVSPEFFIITFALLRIGAVPVLIDPGMGIKALLKALKDINAEAFIGIPKAHVLRFIRPSVFRTIKIRINTRLSLIPAGKRFKKTLNDSEKRYHACQVDNNTLAAIFFTSGSTGPAKGVMYSSGMLKAQIQVTRSQFKIRSDEIDLCTFPLLGLFAICHGNSSVIADMNMIHPATLDPEKVIKNIQDFGCTQMFGSPMILKKLSHYGSVNNIRLHSLRLIISAGAPVHRSILESFSKMISSEARIHTPYGATEALPVTDINTSELLLKDSDKFENENGICIGYPINGLDVRIIEITDNQILFFENANQLPDNEVGEIIVKGPWVTNEYFNNPGANRVAKISDSRDQKIWHRMGDIGRIDTLGKLWFYGRKSHRVITPEGVLFTIPCEAVFNQHPLVSRSALVGIPDFNTGSKKPVICIQTETGVHPTEKLRSELMKLGHTTERTKEISDILFFNKFPVDPRHNAKIFREKLAIKAAKRIK